MAMVAKTPECGARLDSHASTTLSLSYSVQLRRSRFCSVVYASAFALAWVL